MTRPSRHSRRQLIGTVNKEDGAQGWKSPLHQPGRETIKIRINGQVSRASCVTASSRPRDRIEGMRLTSPPGTPARSGRPRRQESGRGLRKKHAGHTLAPHAIQASADGYRTPKESGNSGHLSSRISGATAVGTPPSLHPRKNPTPLATAGPRCTTIVPL